MADIPIDIIVNPTRAVAGARQIESAVGRIEDRAARAGSGIGRLLGGLAGAFSVREFVRAADAFQNLQNRLRLVTDGTAQLGAVTEELFASAQRTRASFAATADLYSRLAQSSRELGLNQQQLLGFTESLNKAIILSGASAQEAQAGLIQLSQGIASGTLRGDELRSVLEQLPAVADVIARGLGVTRGELRELGRQGKITGRDIIDAFAKSRAEIDGRFAKTLPTIGQDLQTIGNEFTALAGLIAQQSGTVISDSLGFVREQLAELREGMEAFQAQFRAIEQEAGLSRVGAQLNALRRELQALEGRQVISEAAQERIEQLRAGLGLLTEEARQTTQALTQAETAAAQLERERQTGVRKATREPLQDLQDEIDLIRVRVALGRDFADALEIEQEIRRDGGRLSLEEAAGLVQVIRQRNELAGLEVKQDFHRQLQDEVAVLQTRVALGDAHADSLAQVQDLQRQGVAISLEEAAAILAINQQLEQLNLQLALQVEQRQLVRDQAQLNAQLRDGSLAAREFSLGFQQGLVEIGKQLVDISGLVSGLMVNAFGAAEDAFVQWARTGEFSSRQLIDQLQADLARLIFRLLIVQALQLATGTGPVSGGAVTQVVGVAGRRHGGEFDANQPLLVGEAGPELVRFNQGGDVTPAGETQMALARGRAGGGAAVAEPPQLNVQVVNVQDPNEVPNAMDSPAGDRVILNALSRNKGKARRLLA